MTPQSKQAEDIQLSLLPAPHSDAAKATLSPLQPGEVSSNTITDDEICSVSLSRRSSQASLVSVASSQAQTQADGPVRRFLLSINTHFQNLFGELESAAENRLKRSKFYGWRMGVLLGSCISALVLCCNVAVVVIGSLVHSRYQDGIANVMYGGASSISRWSTFFHLLINIGSTTLLAASNYTMQVLCSPTRRDIDIAHAHGKWVDIGLLSFRNLKAIPRKRAVLALVLAFSSIPLHLFYNAAVFQIATYNEYNITMINYESQAYNDLNNTAGGTFRNLSNAQWKQVYDTKFVSGYGDLFLAIDRIAFSSSNLPTSPNINDYLPLYIEKGNQAIIQNLTIESSDWIRYDHSTRNPVDKIIPISANVEKAFAKIIPPMSRIQISLYFMVTVIAFNLLKLVIMLWVLFTDKHDYIITLGDASATFLKHPDPETCGKCTYGKEEMLYYLGHMPYYVKGDEGLIEEYFSDRLAGTWLSRTRPYFAFISQDRQVFFALLFCLIVSANVLTPIFGFTVGSAADKGSWGTSSDDILPFGSGILFNAWIVNLPQLVLSLCYLALNSICTSMASAKEWNNLAQTRKGLRVTRPEGSQRSTYFLQLPYKWATPLLFTSGLLHWLLSQSFFLVRLDIINREGVVLPESSMSACGFSRLSLLIFFVIAFLMLCAIGVIGLQPLEQKIPMAASCSLVISAACHPPKLEIDTQLKEVKWGVAEEQTQQGYAHCSITAMPTKKRKLVEGRVYR